MPAQAAFSCSWRFRGSHRHHAITPSRLICLRRRPCCCRAFCRLEHRTHSRWHIGLCKPRCGCWLLEHESCACKVRFPVRATAAACYGHHRIRSSRARPRSSVVVEPRKEKVESSRFCAMRRGCWGCSAVSLYTCNTTSITVKYHQSGSALFSDSDFSHLTHRTAACTAHGTRNLYTSLFSTCLNTLP